MLYFVIYCLLSLLAGIVSSIQSWREQEDTKAVIQTFFLALSFAPFVWLYLIFTGFDEACDKCDVKRGIRIPKSHRITYDSKWWPEYYVKNYSEIRLRKDYSSLRMNNVDRMSRWAVFHGL